MAQPEDLAQQIYAEALTLPSQDRDAFLQKACLASPAVQAEVNALLAEHERMGSFLNAPLFSANHTDDHDATAAPTGPDLPPGRSFGRYSILAPLGKGGMGSVYSARDEKLQRTVAIKVLSPDILTTPEARRRFRKEALALAKLSHPNIAIVYDVGEQDGVDYIVMECVPGEPLSTRLLNGPLSVGDATSIVHQVAQALEEAHANGIIHRDLKPANVIITPRGQAKVLDFGIAKLVGPLAASPETLTHPNVLIGTPRYMSPEQAQGKDVDARTDIWSLGVLYYEALTARAPFRGADVLTVFRAIVDEQPEPIRKLRPDTPAPVERIVTRALQKNPNDRYATAADFSRDAADVLTGMSGNIQRERAAARSRTRWLALTIAAVVALAIGLGFWYYHHVTVTRWAREDAPPQIDRLQDRKKPLAAFLLLTKARAALPSDAHLQQVNDTTTTHVAVNSSPVGALVRIQDYLTPDGPWYTLGKTPIQSALIPQGYFRWKLSSPGVQDLVAAPETTSQMHFILPTKASVPPGMVEVPAQTWGDYISFIGWMGPYRLPAFFVDRLEVTNAEYQRFVDADGYTRQQYWTEPFAGDGHSLTFTEAMARFRDTTGRPGPSTWIGGHFPEGQANLPVTGISWFEASAYAAFVGKQLPVAAQWFEIAPPYLSRYIVQQSNLGGDALKPVGTLAGVGPFGTYDTAGNAREWTANTVDGDLRFILGGSWKSPTYLYYSPEALSPFDRSDTNGFRCVKNASPLAPELLKPVARVQRDFTTFHTVPNDVFHAYTLLYAYPKTPLHATEDGIVAQTIDWTEEKVSYDAGYEGQRMSAYLFLPKNVKPPYQTVLFFPSARVLFLPESKDSLVLGDVKFFDYIIQSGRAVMYPVYEGTYDRRLREALPSASQSITLTTHHYKDAARSLDYLATRNDIDSTRLAYLGVSMGAAEGVIITSLLQDRLRTAILLDGGYFLDPAPPGADPADFAVRMKKPVLMVNGRYDFTFPLTKAQDPLFNMLGTPPAEKRHVVLDTPHDVTEQRPQLIQAVLNWLDTYLGRVTN